MKILLTLPLWGLEEHWDFNVLGKRSKDIGSIERPLGISYLAANLIKVGYDVSLMDPIAEELSDEEFAKRIEEGKYDIVGISVLSNSCYKAILTAKIIKKINPKCIVIIGGPHITCMQRAGQTKYLLREEFFDYAVFGEGEITIVELVKAIENKGDISRIEGVIWKDENGQVIVNPPRPPIEDLDSLPFPDFDLLKKDGYKRTPSSFKKEPVYPVMIGRGCPYNCVFCAKVFGRRVRMRSVDNVIKELKHLKKSYGAKEIRMWDETFTLDKEYIIKLCKRMIEEKINLSWSCYGHVNTADEETYCWMKKAGCWEIDFGIEAGTDPVLKAINKNITIEQVERDVKLVQKVGMEARAFFILGLPDDTEESVKETINFALRINPDYAAFYLLQVYPGSQLFDDEIKNGNIREEELNEYFNNGKIIYYKNPNINHEKLQEYLISAHQNFYRRPSYMLSRLSKIRTLSDVKRYLKGGIAVLSIKKSHEK